jgi:hypothetical protein
LIADKGKASFLRSWSATPVSTVASAGVVRGIPVPIRDYPKSEIL